MNRFFAYPKSYAKLIFWWIWAHTDGDPIRYSFRAISVCFFILATIGSMLEDFDRAIYCLGVSAVLLLINIERAAHKK